MKDDVSVSDEGRLAYAFTGVAKGGDIKVHVEAGEYTNYVQYNVADQNDPTDTDDMADLYVPEGTNVTVTNLAVYNNKTTSVSETWAKVTWQNPEWNWKTKKVADGKNYFNVTRSGWVKLAPDNATAKIELHDAYYTVAADSVNVRSNWGDASNLIMSLNKGVQIEVNLVALIGENMWGRFELKKVSHVGDKDATLNTAGYTIGYVNLASKYFTRDGAPTLEEDDDSLKDMIATVVGTDSLRVRKTGSTFA